MAANDIPKPPRGVIMGRCTSYPETITVSSAAATATAIDISSWAGATVWVVSAASITSVAIHVSYDGTTYYALTDSAGSAVTFTPANTTAHEINPAAFACPYMKLIRTAGSDQTDWKIVKKS